MEDIGKALIMAAQVLMFAFAATIAIYLYSTLTTRADNVMLTDNYSNRGDAIVGIEDEDNERTVKRAEIVMAILDLKTKYEKTGDDSYVVIVNGKNFKYDGNQNKMIVNSVALNIESNNLKTQLQNIQNRDYKLTYSNDSKTLRYN